MLTLKKQICTFDKAVTAHIWDFVILADINKFPKAMQGHNHLREMAQIVTRNIISELNVSERKHFPDNRRAACQHWLVAMHRCAQTCVQILRPIHPVYTVRIFVSVLSLLYFFPSSSVCQSVRPSVCISPSWQPAYSPPTPFRCYLQKWLLSENTSPCFVRSPVLQIFFFWWGML